MIRQSAPLQVAMVAYSCVGVSRVELADERAGTGSVKTSERFDAGIGIPVGVFEHELVPPTGAAARGVDILHGKLHSRGSSRPAQAIPGGVSGPTPPSTMAAPRLTPREAARASRALRTHRHLPRGG
jgi:hypothetical protein